MSLKMESLNASLHSSTDTNGVTGHFIESISLLCVYQVVTTQAYECNVVECVEVVDSNWQSLGLNANGTISLEKVK